MNSKNGAIGRFEHEEEAARAGYDVKLTDQEAEYLSTLPPDQRMIWLSYKQNQHLEQPRPSRPSWKFKQRKAKSR